MPPEFHFLRPLWLLALLPLAALVWALARAAGSAEAWRTVVDPHLLAHLLEDDGARVRRLPLVLLAFGWLLGVIALAGPVWERLPQPVYQTEAKRVIALDISPSMNAADLAPSRLARARFKVLDMLKRAGDGQTALLAYGAEPFIVSPLTNDAETIAAQVPNLETDLLPVRGTGRADLALEHAGKLLEQAGSRAGDIILVTDAPEPYEATRAVVERLRSEGFRLSILGVGTEEGAPVPREGGGFATNAQGGIRIARLEADRLRTLAAAGGGRYETIRNDDADIKALIPEERGPLSHGGEQRDLRADQWREEGPWLLLLVLPLAALAFRRGWISPMILALLIATPPPAEAFDWDDLWLRLDQQAARAFDAGDHASAAAQFRRPDWRAAAQYEGGDYGQALQTLKDVEGPESGYNRGNALARLGQYEQAVAEYEKVLAEDPEHADARHNRDLLRRLLEEQKQPKQQEQQGKQEQRGQQNEGSQSDQDGSQQDHADQGQSQQSDQPQSKQDQSGQAQQDQSQRRQGQEHQSDQTEDGADTDDASRDEDRTQGGGSEEERNPQDTQDTGAKQDTSQADARPQKPDAAKAQSQAQAQADRESRQTEPAASSAEAADERSGMPKATQPDEKPASARAPEPAEAAAEPDVTDLLGSRQGPGQPQTAVAPAAVAQEREDREAMEHMLRRVPDDPGGLLRQRFLLQHLRRSGRLP